MKFSLRQPVLASCRLRKARLASGDLKWGKNVYVGSNCAISAVNFLKIGSNVYIGRNVAIEIEGEIGDGCLIANNVGVIGRRDHDPSFPGDLFFAPHATDRSDLRDWTCIENGVWIGFGAVVLSGIRICRRSIISAGAIITHDVPPGSIVTRSGMIIPRKMEDIRPSQLSGRERHGS